MGSRLGLQSLLESILGSTNVYYQPPASIKLSYPCIIYSRSADDVKRADDQNYLVTKKYELLLIDRNPDSIIPDSIVSRFTMCKLNRIYRSDNLYHYAFDLYY